MIRVDYRLRLSAVLILAAAAAVFVLCAAGTYRRVQRLQLCQEAPPLSASSPTGYQHGLRYGMLLASSIDGYQWIMHTQQMVQEGSLRCHHTLCDNAPGGREVHWSSGLMWWLAGLGLIHHGLTGQPIAIAIEAAAQYAMPVLYAVLVTALGSWTWRRFGVLPTVALVVGLLVLKESRATWTAGYFDHHGLVALILLWGTIAAAYAQLRTGGITYDTLAWVEARKAMLHSGLLSGIALWISAATSIPALAAMGLGGACCLIACGDTTHRLLVAKLWRIWGRSAAVASLMPYLIEYFPNQLGWRLEVNHPVYAVACLAAGELLFCLATQLTKRTLCPTRSTLPIQGLCLVTLACIPLLMLFRYERFFWVADPVVLSVHKGIQEFGSLASLMTSIGMVFPSFGAGAMFSLILLIPLSVIMVSVRVTRNDIRCAIVLILAPTVVFALMTLWQCRWLYILQPMLLGLMLVMLGYRSPAHSRWQIQVVASAAGILIMTILCSVPVLNSDLHELTGRQLRLFPDDVAMLTTRDLAYQLRGQCPPAAIPVVLTGPTATTLLAYWGNCRGIGTLYWENRDGLNTAVLLYASLTEAECRGRLRSAGVTHVVALSGDYYVQGAGGGRGEVDSCWLPKLIKNAVPRPSWCREEAYSPPTYLGEWPGQAKIFAVAP